MWKRIRVFHSAVTEISTTSWQTHLHSLLLKFRRSAEATTSCIFSFIMRKSQIVFYYPKIMITLFTNVFHMFHYDIKVLTILDVKFRETEI